jgi:hypothetical protein
MVGELSYPGRDLVSVSVVVDMGLSEKKGKLPNPMVKKPH